MDRIQAFVEYAQILNDGKDWLTGGFRRARKGESQINIPRPASGEGTAVADSLAGNPAVPSAPGGVAPQSDFRAPSSAADSPDAQAEASALEGDTILSQQSEAPAAASSAGSAPASDNVPSAPASRKPDLQAAPSQVENPRPDSPLGLLATEISTCHNCNLYLLREQTVPGIGSDGATLMVVTPPPADSAGELSSPLPAYESEYLGKWLGALGLNGINDVFITPAVKCRTPGGRPPQKEEATACAGYLQKQYKAVAPKAVLALGGAACGALTGNPADFPSLVGKEWTWGAVPALVLWTPAEVLANPGRLRQPVWDALQRLKVAWNAVPGNQL